jgi:hypothetical protein
MLDVGGVDDFAGLLIEDCDACIFRAGIDFDI